MKGKFDAYVLWPLAWRDQNWMVNRFTVCNYAVKSRNPRVPDKKKENQVTQLKADIEVCQNQTKVFYLLT